MQEKINKDKYMVVSYKIKYDDQIFDDICYHVINRTDIDGTCIDPDYEIEESIKHDSDGELISWKFIGYK